ncbi:MAG: CdaR family protein [Thermodesulfovibrionales bacterium]|jgi:YbbR domain-containing protein
MNIAKGLFGNMGLKLLAVALSVSLWFYVTYRGLSEMIIEVPLEVRSVPKGLELVKQNVKRVNIQVSGNERFLKNLRPLDARVVVDLSRAKKGEATFYLERDDITIPAPVKVLRIDPANVRLTLDETIAKAVPVRAVVVGSPRRGYLVRSVHVAPEAVLLEGARTEVERISVITTEPVDISGLSSEMKQTVKLSLRENIRTKVSEVSVKIAIGRYR